MTLSDLGRRVGLSFQALSQFEKAEREGTITLSTLRTVADALGCDLVYALVPRESLQASLEREAHRRARRMLDRVRHSMSLEAQDISEEEMENQLRELTEELLAGSWRKIWKEL
jgi:predicted DNA-binding mobile mystery protein A